MNKNFFFNLIFGLAIITAVFLTIYVTGQQVLRQSANDPQIQMAEDTAASLANGSAVPADFMPASRQPFDMSQSLAPFTMIFDRGGTLLESSATLAGEAAVPPVGVFGYAKLHGEDRFTWQPAQGERFAAVLKYYTGGSTGFVLVGRSLREVEVREDNLLKIVALAWLGCVFIFVVGIFGEIFFGEFFKK
jgi:hypothetical protein